jgi:hypothetical protein
MAFIPDLAPCTYLTSPPLPMVAVGWLEPPHPFSQGILDALSRQRLDAQVQTAVQFVTFRGWHECLFCPDSLGHAGHSLRPHGLANCVIVGAGVVFACPEPIIHYVDAHDYRPPDAFLRALEVAPLQGSREYYAGLLTAGGDLVEEYIGRLSLYAEGDEKRVMQQAIVAWRLAGRPLAGP